MADPTPNLNVQADFDQFYFLGEDGLLASLNTNLHEIYNKFSVRGEYIREGDNPVFLLLLEYKQGQEEYSDFSFPIPILNVHGDSEGEFSEFVNQLHTFFSRPTGLNLSDLFDYIASKADNYPEFPILFPEEKLVFLQTYVQLITKVNQDLPFDYNQIMESQVGKEISLNIRKSSSSIFNILAFELSGRRGSIDPFMETLED